MDDARAEAASNIGLKNVDDVRDDALSSVTSYEKGRHIFETMNGCKNKNVDGNFSSIDSVLEGCVRDRKKFFEHHIIEQQQRENGLISSSPSGCTSPSTFVSILGESSSPSFIEERTDSESFFRKKTDMLESERNDSSDDIRDRMGPESLSRVLQQKSVSKLHSGSDRDPSEVLKLESSYNSSNENADRTGKTFRGNKFLSTDPTVGSIAVSHSCHYIKKSQSLDRKILALPNVKDEEESRLTHIGYNAGLRHNTNSTKDEPVSYGTLSRPEESVEDTRQTNRGDGIMLRSSEGGEIRDEIVRNKNQSNLPIVKVHVKNEIEDHPNENTSPARWESKIDIDEMITEFQQASANLSDKLMLTGDHSGDKPNSADINQDNDISQIKMRNNIISRDSHLAPKVLTPNVFNELNERVHVSHSKDKITINNYVYPSESTDYSIDSKGNSKATKSISSKSAKSAMKVKGKGSGMGKMLKKAKKGMGKSVKNLTEKSVSQISQLTSIVKNTIKSKPTKQSIAAIDQSCERISDQKNCMEFSDFFDEKLAEELVKDSIGEAGIIKASQYLDSGNRLLQSRTRLKKTNDLRGSKEVIQKAHTYAYVGRQLAKQYLLSCRQELREGIGTNPTNTVSSVNGDGITIFEDFFLSFLQCVGPCNRDYTVEHSRLQVIETLDILDKLSEEEANVMENHLSKEIKKNTVLDRKVKVQVAIADTRDSADRENMGRMKDAYHERSLAIQNFVSALRSFYEVDTTLKISKAFLKCNRDKKDDDSGSLETDTGRSFLSESLSYNYSESLKSDHGRSFNTTSFTSVGSMNQEEPPSSSPRRGRKSKDESLAEGIHPGTTVVAISVKNKNFKNKGNGTNKKKKQPLPKKWLPVSGRKYK